MYGISEEDEELEQKKQTQLGYENGKRAAKKQQKKNERKQIIKTIWKKYQ